MKTFVLNGWAAGEAAWSLCRFHRDRIFSYIEQLDGEVDRAMESTKEPVTLVGWSMGGSMALKVLLDHPDRIANLVLLAATPRMMEDKSTGWKGMSPRRLEAFELGLKLTRGDGFFPRPEGRPNPYMIDTDSNLRRGLDYLLETDLRSDLAELKDLPPRVALFHAAHDGIVRPENLDYLKSIFPHAASTVVPGCEHALPIEIPQLIDEAV